MKKDYYKDEAIRLRKVEGLSVIEIATRLNQSISTVAEWLAIPRGDDTPDYMKRVGGDRTGYAKPGL
ncbi:unnamed protein product [marine sediment metagenome]|uniref:Uncharacterized protein n=1 Tax=marine sediment metagenome TaxID=412755 RepID=X1K6C0_9ZZZZ